MIEKNQLLKKKIKIQQVKNKLKLLNGIEILETFENDENRRLNEMFSDYYPVCDSRDERIDGAVKMGKTWIIPKDAKKPADGRRKEFPNE